MPGELEPMTGETDTQRDPFLAPLIGALAEVPGVAAVVLGGSRARGTAHPNSDYDIGLYFREALALDTDRLRDVAEQFADNSDTVTPVGEWGPWIIGGAWLQIGAQKVDLLYRNIDAVRRIMADCRTGQISMDYQPGHPHGFCSAIWMGEVACCEPLSDPHNLIAELKSIALPYPEPLREALIRRFEWEILFSIENAELAVLAEDQAHVTGCAYRALTCIAQVLFAINRRYLINEKGALREAAEFPLTIHDLTERTAAIWRRIGNRAYETALTQLRGIERELRALECR
jgi:predicted nucleotidyltransferase